MIQVKAEPKSPKSGGWQDGKKSKDGGIKVKLICSKDLESMPFQTRWRARGKEEQSKGGGIKVQGVPKKMQHSDFPLRSVLEVQFNLFTCVPESEFRALSIWAHYRYLYRI